MMDYFSHILPDVKRINSGALRKFKIIKNLHLNFNAKTNKAGRMSIPQNGLHFMCKLEKPSLSSRNLLLN
jgi:hypothetical protein